jgi:hypothetical protein
LDEVPLAPITEELVHSPINSRVETDYENGDVVDIGYMSNSFLVSQILQEEVFYVRTKYWARRSEIRNLINHW